MRKLTAALLSAVLLSAILLTACAMPLKISDEEALAVLQDLVPKSHAINVIFFGEGLPAVEEGYEEEHTDTAYFPVREDCGYDSIRAIREAAERIYSSRYLEGVYVTAFQGLSSESSDGMVDLSYSARYREIGGKLMVNVAAPSVAIRGELQVLTAEVGKKTPDYVVVSSSVTENGKTFTVEFFLTRENGVWLLDGPTY